MTTQHTPAEAKALVAVSIECGQNVDEEEFGSETISFSMPNPIVDNVHMN